MSCLDLVILVSSSDVRLPDCCHWQCLPVADSLSSATGSATLKNSLGSYSALFSSTPPDRMRFDRLHNTPNSAKSMQPMIQQMSQTRQYYDKYHSDISVTDVSATWTSPYPTTQNTHYVQPLLVRRGTAAIGAVMLDQSRCRSI